MFTWSALYADEKVLLQMDNSGTEHLFKEIEQDKLVRFGICNGERHIVVDLRNGRFYIDNIPIIIPKVSDEENREYRLIYFRRVRKSIGTRPGMDGSETEHFIGFQTTIDGVNEQAMVSVVDADQIAYKVHIK